MLSSNTPSFSADDPDFLDEVNLRLIEVIQGYKPDSDHPADSWVNYFMHGGEKPHVRMSSNRMAVRTILCQCLEDYPEDQVPNEVWDRLCVVRS